MNKTNQHTVVTEDHTKDLDEQIALAETIARRVFDGVTDLTGTPYIEHVRRVAAGVPRWAQAAAWLHDVIEDTDTTAEDLLAEGISQDTVDAVVLLTRVSGDGRTYMQYVQALADADGLPGDIARAVKQSDLHDNLGRPTPPEMEGIDRRYKRALVIAEAGIAAHL